MRPIYLFVSLFIFIQVCVFFNSKLFRGNRTIKRSNGSLEAFDSPNLAPLATFGIDVTGNPHPPVN